MSFIDIYGHKKQISILQGAMAKNRVSHAYLFYGIEGIGKKLTAMIFAKALNCQKGENFDACDSCSSCLKVEHKNHPDVITIEAESQFIRIQEIRKIQEQMQFRPLEGGKRIIIMVDADKMNVTSANALLKTLEEPSPANILILVTSRFYHLPVTIISRCQHVRFNPLKTNIITSFLQDRCCYDSDLAYRLASSSEGSIGKAIEMNKNAYLRQRDEILNELWGTHNADPLKILSCISDFGQERKSAMVRLNILRTCFRDALIYKETGESINLIHQDRMDIIKSIADSLSGWDILNNIQVIDTAYGAIELNANKQLTIETMMFNLIIK